MPYRSAPLRGHIGLRNLTGLPGFRRVVGQQTLEMEFLKGALSTAAEKRAYARGRRPRNLSVAQGCRLMGLARSTYYDRLTRAVDDADCRGLGDTGPCSFDLAMR